MEMISSFKRIQTVPWLLLRGVAGFMLLFTQYDEILYLTDEGFASLLAIFILLGGCPTCYVIHLLNAFRKNKQTTDCTGLTCKTLSAPQNKKSTRMLVIVAVIGATMAATTYNAYAGSCATDIAAIDQTIKDQYVKWGWNNFLVCAVCLGMLLKDDAIVTRSQINEIGKIRQMAVKMNRDGFEMECREALKTPKRMLKIYS